MTVQFAVESLSRFAWNTHLTRREIVTVARR